MGQDQGGRRSLPVGVLGITVTFSTGKRPGKMPWRRRRPTSVLSMSHGADYNTWLELPGRTSGNRPSMRWLVRWLRPKAHPRIVQDR